MKKEELVKKIEDLKEHIFMIDMIDRWDSSTREVWHKLNKELVELEAQLKGLEPQKA